MACLATYPVICTRMFAKTVAFYEDIFGLVPDYEEDGYVRLRQPDAKEILLVVLDINSKHVPDDYRHETRGFVPIITTSFEETYDALYHEGIEIVKEPTLLDSGLRHFLAVDPHNPIVITILSPQAGT